MGRIDFEKLLKQWSSEILQCEALAALLPESARSSEWVGEPPASRVQLEKLEARIDRKLPPSLRTFLEVSNGWRFFDDAHGSAWRALLGTEDIDLLARKDCRLVDIWTAPTHYDVDEAEVEGRGHMPHSQLRQVVQISTNEDGLFFLNPLQRLDDDEWECFFFAAWVPGEESRGTFGDLVVDRHDAFVAANVAKSSHRRSAGRNKRGRATHTRRNLGQPPSEQIEDPNEFLTIIDGLGYFDRTPAPAAERMRSEFREQFARIKADPTSMYRELISPARALLTTETERVCALDIDDTATGGVRHAAGRVRPLLAARGIELPHIVEERNDIAWVARLEQTERCIARMRKGRPLGAGMQHAINVAQHVTNETCHLLNRWFITKGLAPRVCSISDLRGYNEDMTSDMRFGLVVLDDELAYHFMWQMVGCYCRVLRPDVL